MSDFKAKMHQIRFLLGNPAGGAYVAPPNPLAGFKGLLLRGGRRGEWKERDVTEGEGKLGKGREGRKRREGKGRVRVIF